VKLLSIQIVTLCFSLMLSSASYSADAELIQRLDRLERLLQSQGLLDMLQQIEAAQQELSALQGEIEFQNHTLEQLKKRQRDLYTDIDQRLQNLERSQNPDNSLTTDIIMLEDVDTANPPLQTLEPIGNDIRASTAVQQSESSLMVEVIENETVQTPVQQSEITENIVETVEQANSNTVDATLAPAPVVAELDPVQIRAQYQQAFKLLKQSQYEQAIKAFREFLAANPQSEYSDNAQYWLGEAFYVTRQFEQALLEYNKLIENYPDSKKLTHSLLKIGFCYQELQQLEEAILRLENLKKQHPGTTAARLAEERLKKIAQSEQQGVESELSN